MYDKIPFLKKMSRMTAISPPLALVESPSGRHCEGEAFFNSHNGVMTVNKTLLIRAISYIGASLRVSTQFIGHNVHMTESEFATLAEILKCLNINMLRKSVIGRNEAIHCKLIIYRLLRSYQ